MRKHRLLLSFVLLSISFFLQAQQPSFDWAYQLGANNAAIANQLSGDPQGNLYSLGRFRARIDLDPGAGSMIANTLGTDYNAYIQKVDSNGLFIWGKHIGGSDEVIPVELVVDPHQNVYVTGTFRDTIYLDSNLSGSPVSLGQSRFLQKLDSNGNSVWAHTLVGSGYGIAGPLALDAQNNVYTMGFYSGTIDLDPGADSAIFHGNTTYFQKFDENGNLLWVKTFDGIMYYHDINITAQADIYIAGSFIDTLDFDPDSSTAIRIGQFPNRKVAFVLKLDSAAQFQWVNTLPTHFSTYETEALDLTTDPNGFSYSCGWFQGTVDFDPGPAVQSHSTTNNYPFFIQKNDPQGNLVWVKVIRSAQGFDVAYEIELDQANNVYAYGLVSSPTDFDPDSGIALLNASNSAFTLKLNADGKYQWAQVLDASNGDLYIDHQGDIYSCGFFSGTLDFNPGSGSYQMTSTAQFGDAYVQKINNCPINTTISQQAFQLTSNQLNATTYQWLDCANNYAPIAGATAATYTATSGGSYAVEIRANHCIDTSACQQVFSVGIEEYSTTASDLKIYPNPAKDVTNIQLSKDIIPNLPIQLYSIEGKLLMEVLPKAYMVQLTLNELSSGLYLIRYGSSINKLVIQ